ncbi:MAG: alpha/beta hydrolase [Acidobacteriia bacterium]|nr:alpha/beta hydrolase [Methyloceanibacter sp.]MCL6490581.1 alpha/beta hydrolase [Terriglobia bacterium]
MPRAGLLLFFLFFPLAAFAAGASGPTEPLGIDLEGFPYPYPVSFFPLEVNHHPVRMAFMDVAPKSTPNSRAVLLLHGRNFPASYWQPVIDALIGAGYRVIAPDQIGFGKSSKPEGDWSFDRAAAETAELLDFLHIGKVDVVGHSMGGMLAVRFTRTFPERVQHLVLEAPLGLEDYRFYVPPVPESKLIAEEMARTEENYRHYLRTAYGTTLSDAALRPFIEIRERIKRSGDYPRWVEAFVASYYAIWGQPTVHELPLVSTPTLFLVGTRDHTAPGRAYAKPEDQPRMGHIVELAHAASARMAHAQVMEFDTGHLVHLEAPEAFNRALLRFLETP